MRPMHSAPRRQLRARGVLHQLDAAPWIMAIINATPDSFSDARDGADSEQRIERGRAALRHGARVIDVGGESNVSNRPAVAPVEEISRVVPVIEGLAQAIRAGGDDPGACEADGVRPALISIDTYKPAVAAAAIEAGAAIVNDISGLRDPELADVCAASGAALVLMHTRVAPKSQAFDPDLDGRVVEDALRFLGGRIELALARGVAFEQLIVDPGPDFGKTPAQTIELLRALDRFHELERPLLLAVSRKDFIGALTGRAPREREPATLAAVAHGVAAGAHILRVHDVAAVADFLKVDGALRGSGDPPRDLRLAEELRRVPVQDASD